MGKNGAGKTTLLRLIAGELTLDRDDKRQGPGIRRDRQLMVGSLSQQVFSDLERTLEEEMLASCPAGRNFPGSGLNMSSSMTGSLPPWDSPRTVRGKKLSRFSGGQQTRLGLIRLFLQKPDILLLDEPTNHLDLEAVEWLEEQVREYEKAVVLVSHDRFFLDRTAQVTYELENGRLTRYPGNYTAYRAEKEKRTAHPEKSL